MRKTRLVILPTKCLHQMGFLLLFLSCPVIGDWGRIRPDTETSHKAIQIDREGTCGLLRDHPAGLLDFINEDGFKQCRLGEHKGHDFDKQLQEPVPEERSLTRRSDVRRVYAMRRTIENKERNARESMLRRVVSEREDVRRERQGEKGVRRISSRRDMRNVHQGSIARSRSLERDVRVRNEDSIRSRSLSRLGNEERTIRRQRSMERVEARNMNFRRETMNERNSRKANDRRLSLARQINERNDERRIEQQRRLNRGEMRNDRRENERAIRSQRREVQRENNERSFPRSVERREFHRERTENSLRQSNRRENDRTTRRTTAVERREIPRHSERAIQRTVQTRRENERASRLTTRLSQTRREQEMQTERRDTRRVERFENLQERRSADENREIRTVRKSRSLEFQRNNFRLDDKTTRRSRSVDSRRAIEMRHLVSSKVGELRNTRDERRMNQVTTKGGEGIRVIQYNMEPKQKKPEQALENKDGTKVETDGLLGGFMKWTGLNNLTNIKIGEWTTNCVIGAVAYFLTYRRVKTA